MGWARLREARGFALVHAFYLCGQTLGRSELRHPSLIASQLAMLGIAWRWPRSARWTLCALGILQCVLTFPRTANHAFLAAAAGMLAAATWDDLAEHRWQLGTLPIVALFWSGVQKLCHGLWFEGQALASLMVLREDVAQAARPLLSAELAARLHPLHFSTPGAGPFRLSGGWTLLSNLVWGMELAAPLLLLSTWGRRQVWWMLIAASWGLQWIAHEWEFALVLTHLSLVGAPGWAQVPGRCAVALGVVGLAALRLTGAHVPGVWWP